MSNIVLKQIGTLAGKLGMEADAAHELMGVLKATAFKGEVTDAQLSALLVVANQYGLNPWTKEIYAFPDKKNGIVPVVGVDGWSRIINENPQFDGMEFRQAEKMIRMPSARIDAPEWMECVMYRKDRSRPVVIREYLDEVYREPFKGRDGYQVDGPWQSHTKRFLRHKTMIQCARLAFGFVGIYDEDEAERITERDMGSAQVVSSRPVSSESSSTEVIMPAYPQDKFEAELKGSWQKLVDEGRDPERIIKTVSTRYTLSDKQQASIRALAKPVQTDPITEEQAASIRVLADEYAIGDADICARFGIASIEVLPADQCEAANTFIRTGE
jgi:phage recombination protein Bet